MHFEENMSKECIKEIDEMHFKNVLTPGKIVDKVIDPKTVVHIKCIVPIIKYFFGSKSNIVKNERLNHAKIKYAYIIKAMKYHLDIYKLREQMVHFYKKI